MTENESRNLKVFIKYAAISGLLYGIGFGFLNPYGLKIFAVLFLMLVGAVFGAIGGSIAGLLAVLAGRLVPSERWRGVTWSFAGLAGAMFSLILPLPAIMNGVQLMLIFGSQALSELRGQDHTGFQSSILFACLCLVPPIGLVTGWLASRPTSRANHVDDFQRPTLIKGPSHDL